MQREWLSDVVVTGVGRAVGLPCNSTPWLKVPKNRKFMGPQDELAVVAAAQAVAAAGLCPAPASAPGSAPASDPRPAPAGGLGERAGLFIAVGYIPFEEDELEVLREASREGDRPSMARFATDGLRAVNPLQTFRCLPNMPAFHVSQNLDLQGPSFVTYPGVGQFYLALEEALGALASARVDVALVMGVAHQDNYLVRRHFARVRPPAERLLDGAGCIVLERTGTARQRSASPCAFLEACEVAYRPRDPFAVERPHEEEGADDGHGAASLAVALASAGPGVLRHHLRGRDGIVASSTWRFP